MKNQIYHILSVLVTIACFTPLLIVLFKKLRSLPFVLFAMYWMLTGIVNLIDSIPGMERNTLDLITILYNTVDMPIVLAIIHFTTPGPLLKKLTGIASPGFLALQLINFAIQGINFEAAKYALAVGLLLALLALGWEISLFMQKFEHDEREKALVFIHAGLLFSYGTFIIIYIFDYFVQIGSRIDNFLIYYISSLVALVIATIGFLSKGANVHRQQFSR